MRKVLFLMWINQIRMPFEWIEIMVPLLFRLNCLCVCVWVSEWMSVWKLVTENYWLTWWKRFKMVSNGLLSIRVGWRMASESRILAHKLLKSWTLTNNNRMKYSIVIRKVSVFLFVFCIISSVFLFFLYY